MSVVGRIYEKAKKHKKTIVLTEYADDRVIDAAVMATEKGIAKIVIVGDPIAVSDKIGGLKGEIKIIDPINSEFTSFYAEELYELRKEKGLSREEADKLIRMPLYFGAMMVRRHDADGMVAGAATFSSDVLRTALQVVKARPETPLASSCQIMDVSSNQFVDADYWVLADCVVNIDPDAQQLAAIALSTAKTVKLLFGTEPKVAMLSFSTKGSAKHKFVDKVATATEIAKKQAPELLIDGELQFDAAIIKDIGSRKCPGSPVAGQANVLIFPDIQSGNIGYKIIERVGGAQFVGSITQGLNSPVNDLSRGCNAKDILNTIAITSVQASRG